MIGEDGVRIYKVPSDRFHPTVVHDKIERKMLREQNIITLSGQHKNNLTEGQVSFNNLDEFFVTGTILAFNIQVGLVSDLKMKVKWVQLTQGKK